MKLVFLFLFISVMCLPVCYGQVNNQISGSVTTGSNIDALDVQRFSLSKITSSANTTSYETIEGTPYIDNNTGPNKNLNLGKFYTRDFEYLETAFARYNAYTDMMEVSLLNDGLSYYFLKKEPDFLYVMLKEKIYRAYTYENSMSYFVIVSKNDNQHCTLLKKERVAYREGSKASSSFVTATPNSFHRLRDTYHLKVRDVIVDVPKKKKDFFELFGNHADEMKSFYKKHNLNVKNESDLLQIVRYYNTLF